VHGDNRVDRRLRPPVASELSAGLRVRSLIRLKSLIGGRETVKTGRGGFLASFFEGPWAS
jgi:hypothetical protein